MVRIRFAISTACFCFASTGFAFDASSTEAVAQNRCARLLRQAEVQAQETLLIRREGLVEKLRELRAACDTKEANVRDAAKAAFLYLALPEFTPPESQLEVLEVIEERLRESSGVDDLLVEVLDRKGGVLFSLGRFDDSLEAFEASLRERTERFGAASVEESLGLLSLGQYYSSLAETREPTANRQRAIELGEAAVRNLWLARGEKDPGTKELVMQFEALLESVGLDKNAATARASAYLQAPPGSNPS